MLDTLIGAGIAVLTVLVSPSAPTPGRVVSDALVPLRHCRDTLRKIGSALDSAWTLDQADIWRKEALAGGEASANAKRNHEEHQLTARWNIRAGRERLVLERTDEVRRIGERVAIQTRSIARALTGGAAEARPMPALRRDARLHGDSD